MADAVQNPASKPGVALVLRGDQGTGKGIFVKHFGKLFGPHYVQISQSSQLIGKFNAILQDKLIVFADEAFWAGDKQAEGVLKALVTEDMTVIEIKNKDAFSVRNFMRIIVASNNDWVVPAGSFERRFCVIDVESTHRQDHPYFAAIENEMNNGGREALMHLLLSRDLTGVNLRSFPKTQALQDQQERGMDIMDKWLLDRLMDGHLVPVHEWEAAIETEAVYDALYIYANKMGQKPRLSQTLVGKKLFKRFPALKKTKCAGQRTNTIGFTVSQRVNGYTFPPTRAVSV